MSCAAIVVAGSVLLSSSASSSGVAGEPDKATAPANINPDKHPVLDPSQIKPDDAPPLTSQQQLGQARAWAAEDPNSRLVCLRADGQSLAGVAELDRVDPSTAPTRAQAAATCNQAASGSRP